MIGLAFRILLLVLLVAPSYGYTRYWNFCQQGNQTIQVLGYISSTSTPVQRSYPGCQIDVYLVGTTTHASIYSTATGTALANPFNANSSGFFFFYVADGHYDVKQSAGGLPSPWTAGDILIYSGQAGGDISPSLIDFGCVGDGTTVDTACSQSAVSSVQAYGGTLLLNAGHVFCIGTLTITGPLNLTGYVASGSGFKRCSTLSTGVGLLDITGSNVTIGPGFLIDGQTTTPQVQVNYKSPPSGSALDNALTLNTSIWIHAGSSYVAITGLTINHTGGYAGIVDARSGNDAHIAITGNTVSNSRSSVCGSTGDYNYGCWTGGFIWTNDGASFAIDDLLFERNRMLQVSGNTIWGHANAIGLQNTGVRVINNYFEDCGLDCIQMQNVNGGIVAHNHGKRVGYVSTTDNTVGAPRWAPASTTPGAFSIPAVAVDTSALVTGVEYADNNFDAINGGWYDGDGYGSGTIAPGVGTSCWYSTDPNAQSGSCGPGGVSTANVAYGVNMGNSAGSALADTNVNIVGGQYNGFGGGAIKIYGCSYCKVIGASINHPNSATFAPILYGPFTISATTYYPTHNEISNNTVFWSPPSIGAIVGEDPQYAAFTSAVVNYVHNNTCIGTTTCYEVNKVPVTTTTTGNIISSSITQGACANPATNPGMTPPISDCTIETHWRTEGTNAGTYVTKVLTDQQGVESLLYSCTTGICSFVPQLAAAALNLAGTETGSNNAIAASISSVALAPGMVVTVHLAHTLQAGANTFNYNSGGPVAIKSHYNVANNIGIAYASGSDITMFFDGTVWVDMSQ